LVQNFLSSIFEAQFGRRLVLQDGSSTRLGEMMDNLNLFFTTYFTLELFVNAYANWLQPFLRNGWNHLDVFIVLMSLLDLGALSIPDWFVKLVRAFRVIRLFGRISALKKMAAAVTASIFPMMNAFVILLIVLSICAFPDIHPHPSKDCHQESPFFGMQVFSLCFDPSLSLHDPPANRPVSMRVASGGCSRDTHPTEWALSRLIRMASV
jgi:hypothetical protein